MQTFIKIIISAMTITSIVACANLPGQQSDNKEIPSTSIQVQSKPKVAESKIYENKTPTKLPITFNVKENINNPLVGHFWSVKEQQLVPWQQIIKHLPKGGWLMLGELHDYSDHQKLESLFISILAKMGRLGNVAMEQLRPEQEMLLDKWYKKGNEVTGEALNWNPNAWDWNAYRQPLSLALNHSLKLIPLELSKKNILEVYLNQQVVEQESAEHKKVLADLIDASHCQKITNKHTHSMVQVQLAKDQFMAQQIASNTVEDKVNVMIAGMHHSRKDFGVPLWLEKIPHNPKVLSVIMIPVTTDAEAKSYLKSQYNQRMSADYLYFTPAKIKSKGACDLENNTHKK